MYLEMIALLPNKGGLLFSVCLNQNSHLGTTQTLGIKLVYEWTITFLSLQYHKQQQQMQWTILKYEPSLVIYYKS